MNSELGNYRIIRATSNDRTRILKFVKVHFFDHQPINIHCNAIKGHTCTDKPMVLFSFGEDNSLLAVIGDGDEEEIIGLCLNGVSKPDHDITDHIYDSCSLCTTILELLAKIDVKANIWQNTGCDMVLDIHVLAVRSDMRRLGLARALFQYTQEMAIAAGFPALTITCSSHYSAALSLKMGMKCLAEIKYDEYLDENGVPVFNPPKPHDSVKTFAKMLKPCSTEL